MGADPLMALEQAVKASGPEAAALWSPLVAVLGEIRNQTLAGGKIILDLEEAMRMAGVGSKSALERWCARWKVRPSAPGRYPRAALIAGLNREARSSLPKRARAETLS